MFQITIRYAYVWNFFYFGNQKNCTAMYWWSYRWSDVCYGLWYLPCQYVVNFSLLNELLVAENFEGCDIKNVTYNVKKLNANKNQWKHL